MRKITYKKLRIQNFLSIGNEVVEIEFQYGLNLITGVNIDNPERKNAVGKSVLIDAFYYALFGKTIREIKKAFIINNVTKGDGLIELEFTVETEEGIKSYKVSRTLKPSAVFLFQGDTDVTNDSIANTNEAICKLIGSNSTICKSCDILSLSDNVPFMAKDAKEKRKFIEDIFSLEIYGYMLEDLKKLIKTNKADSSISSTKLDEMTNNITAFEKQKAEIEKAIAEKEEVLKQKKELLEGKIKDAQESLKAIPEIDLTKTYEDKESYEKAAKKINSSVIIHTQLKSDIRSSVRQYAQNIKDLDIGGIVKCDKCKQDIPHTHIELLDNQKKDLKGKFDYESKNLEKVELELQGHLDKQEKVRLKLVEFDDIIRQAERDKARKESIQGLIIQMQESLENIEDSFKDNSSSVSIVAESIKNAQERKTEESEIYAKLKQQSDDLDTCKFILGEEGVKAFVVKKLLGMLNTSVQTYIKDLGMTMRCSFDEYFEEKITNDKGKEISYWNFSGGERRTVDLACAWAFKDIKRKISGVSSNVEFCDEIFDSAFDERGLDLLIEVLKSRIEKNKMSIYAISHRKETFKHIDGEIVSLEKENGVTRRVKSSDY